MIVTGAGGSGCGRSIALRFAIDGAAVVVSDIDEEGGRNTVRVIEADKGRAAFFQADVRHDSQVQQLVSFAETKFSRLDVLVNNMLPHLTVTPISKAGGIRLRLIFSALFGRRAQRSTL